MAVPYQYTGNPFVSEDGEISLKAELYETIQSTAFEQGLSIFTIIDNLIELIRFYTQKASHLSFDQKRGPDYTAAEGE